MISKRNALRSQKDQLKEDQVNDDTSSTVVTTLNSSSSIVNNNQQHLVKSTLETVQEEESNQAEEIEKQEVKPEPVETKHSVSLLIQPSSSSVFTDESRESMTSAEEESVPKIVESSESQKLYDQLSQLKPMVNKNFKTSASICLTTQDLPSSTTQTSSMVITPVVSNDTIEACPVKNNTVQICLNNNLDEAKSRFNEMVAGGYYTKSGKVKSESEGSSDLGSNSSSSTSISNDSTRQTESLDSGSLIIKADGDLATATCVQQRNRATPSPNLSSSLIIPRRNSTIIAPSNTLITTNTNLATNGSTNTSNSRRVSLSVTDL